MKKAKKRGPKRPRVRLYQRGDIYWTEYFQHGERIRESLKTTDRDIAERERNAIEASLLDPHLRVKQSKNPDVSVFWEKYLAWAREHKRPRTIDTEIVSWEQLIEFTKAKRVGDIRKSHIEAFKKHRRKTGNSDQTVNNKLKDIQAMFNRGIKEGWFTGENPVIGVERYKIHKVLPTFHTEDELNRLLEAARRQGQSVEWTVLLGAWAGLRKLEIVNARWEWFNFDKKRPQISVKRFEEFELKDHEERIIPMNRRIYDTLFPYRKNEGFLFMSAPSSNGKYRYRFDCRKSLDAALQAAGLNTDKPFQRLRETFGSLLVEKGVPIAKVSRWMGHSSIRTTERHYIGSLGYDDSINRF